MINIDKSRSFITDLLARITLHFGKYVYVIAVLLTMITIYGLTNLKVENSFINYFRSDTEIHKGMKLIDNELGGTTPVSYTHLTLPTR